MGKDEQSLITIEQELMFGGNAETLRNLMIINTYQLSFDMKWYDALLWLEISLNDIPLADDSSILNLLWS